MGNDGVNDSESWLPASDEEEEDDNVGVDVGDGDENIELDGVEFVLKLLLFEVVTSSNGGKLLFLLKIFKLFSPVFER